ncbi:winged helix-turn-helix transcriptional regulator [Candidatus Saganbacteria bacterium]|nr:winged helix-turn-helix transcriptional regulator [Candidatus Saganbacteria bacterium]
MKQLNEMHAEVCKTLANPKRIEIINLLGNKELPVSKLLQKTGLLKANLSQHLSVMRTKGIIKARKEGLTVYYRIANLKIIKACDLMREVLFELTNKKQADLNKWKKKQ